MHGFRNYFESYGEFADYLAQSTSGPSPIEAASEVMGIKKVIKINDLIKLLDLIVGVSKMVSMVPATIKKNIDIVYYLSQILRHPKKSIYWKGLAKSMAEVTKLTAANPLILFPAITPFLSKLEPNKQTLVIGALKVLSSIYFYLASMADKIGDNDKYSEIFKHLRPFLPHMKNDQNNT